MIDIATLAKQTGIPAHTLRYYETRGLIAPVSRSGLKRVFADDVVLKLQLIQLGQQVSMSLDDIKNKKLAQYLPLALEAAKADA